MIAMTLLTGCSTGPSGEKPKAEAPASENAAEPAENAAAETVTFGTYQGQPIEWYVLDQDQGGALLLSVHALDSRPFSETPAQWDHSSLRSWMNGDFYQEAFTPAEQADILSSSLDNGDDLNYGTEAGENTEDNVFLLSAAEAKKYLAGDKTTTSPTYYAVSQGAYTNEDGNCAWWLRSPGMTEEGPAYYSSQGEIGSRAHKASETIIGVRPAIRVSADAISS